MSIENLGNPLTAVYSIPGGQARLYQRGMTVKGVGGEVVVLFDFPMIGRPNIVTGNAPPFEPKTITFQPGKWQLEQLTPLLQAALAGRLSLMPTGPGAVQVLLTLGQAELVDLEQTPPLGGISVNPADLFDRTLYDVAILADDGKWRIVAPHAVYHRRTWTNFGIASINDLHVARRIDSFREILVKAGRIEGAQRLINWNDRFRGFVKYANYLHSIGVLDVILAIGDLYDYIYEEDDDPEGGGNAKFLRILILGKAPGPDFPDVEELLVPIFMVPGNHDYRKHPYKLLMFVEALKFFREGIEQYSGYNIGNAEARVIEAKGVEIPLIGGYGVPTVSPDEAARMVEVDPDIKAYKTFLADRLSYVVQLGDHRVVMLDSGPDTGVVTSTWEFIKDWSGVDQFTENEASFIDGNPNSEGISAGELERVSKYLAAIPDGGLFIVGVHAPLFNIWGNVYPYFLRETQRPAQADQVHPFLFRYDYHPLHPEQVLQGKAGVEDRHPLWFPDERDHRSPKFVKRGDSQDLFDLGVSRGKADDLMRLLAGVGSRRPADLVLSGHVHCYNEFRAFLDSSTGKLVYLMDFYTENPKRYYPTRFTMTWDPLSIPETDMTYITIVPGASPAATPSPLPEDSTRRYKYELQVPPYPNPLFSALDPRTWWAEHRPLVLQTGALGPCKKLTGLDKKLIGRFEGFRVLSINADVIDKIHFVSMEELEANQFRLEWEQEPKWLEPALHMMMS